MEINDTNNSLPQSCVDAWERQRGDELRQWQMQERAERLKVLRVILSELAGRLLIMHPDWEIQEQIHLDHASLESRARPNAEAVVVECRWAEDARWQGLGAVEVSIVRFANFRVVAIPDPFEYETDRTWHGLGHLVQGIEREVEQEIVLQALITPEVVTRLAPRSF